MASRLKRFSIEVNVIDTLVFSTEISQTQYNKTLSELRIQYERSKDAEEDCFRAQYRDRTMDLEKYTVHEHRFRVGATDVAIVKRECKPGFYFAK